jgi:hypothetical protein
MSGRFAVMWLILASAIKLHVGFPIFKHDAYAMYLNSQSTPLLGTPIHMFGFTVSG